MQNHQYKIIAAKYTEEGSPTSESIVGYRDDPESIYELYKEYKSQKWDSTGFAVWRVELFVPSYKSVDAESFADMFGLR